ILQRRLRVEHLRHLLVGHRLAELHAELLEPLQEVARVGDGVIHRVAHGGERAELWLLCEVAHANPRVRARLAQELLVDARHDAQKRALPGAVRADHPDFRPREEGERDVLEDLLVGRMDLRHLLHREDELRHGRASIPLRRQTDRDAPKHAEGSAEPSARVRRASAEFTSAGRGGACRQPRTAAPLTERASGPHRLVRPTTTRFSFPSMTTLRARYPLRRTVTVIGIPSRTFTETGI